jgi:putative flippase GtrA
MIRRELLSFGIVGLCTVLTDYLAYQAITWAGCSTDPAKAGGFLTGTLFAYFANRFWTFGHHEAAAGSAVRFGILYAGTLGINVLINAAALLVLRPNQYAVLLAFLLATGVSAAVNFVGMKLVVFRKRSSIPVP